MKSLLVLVFLGAMNVSKVRAQDATPNPLTSKLEIFSAIGVGSPHGALGLGVGLPVGTFQAQASVGFSILGAWRVSAGLQKQVGNWFLGAALSHTSAPSYSTIVVINNSNYALSDRSGNLIAAANSRNIRSAAALSDPLGNPHHYWTSNADFTKQAYYDFTSAQTLHLRVGKSFNNMLIHLGYGLNLNTPYRFAAGDATLDTPWLGLVSPGGIEISVQYRINSLFDRFLKK